MWGRVASFGLFLQPPLKGGALPGVFPWGGGACLEVVKGGGGAVDQTRHWVRNVLSALLGAGGGDHQWEGRRGVGCCFAMLATLLCWSLSSTVAPERVFVPRDACLYWIPRSFGNMSLPTFYRGHSVPLCPFTHLSGSPRGLDKGHLIWWGEGGGPLGSLWLCRAPPMTGEVRGSLHCKAPLGGVTLPLADYQRV